MMLAADLRISEFQAINDSTIDDDDGNDGVDCGEGALKASRLIGEGRPGSPRRWVLPTTAFFETFSMRPISAVVAPVAHRRSNSAILSGVQVIVMILKYATYCRSYLKNLKIR